MCAMHGAKMASVMLLVSGASSLSYAPVLFRGVRPSHATTRRAVAAMNEEPVQSSSSSMPGTPSFEQFKKMMQRDVSPDQLSVGEKVQRGVSKSWVNPAYWNRQFVQASHISNNVPNASRVLELGKDAKNLYYLNSPASCTLIVPPSNIEVKEGPIREAAAKLGVPFMLFTEQALDTIPLRPSTFDAALCFDMLDSAPEQAKLGAISLLGSSLVANGRLLFLERESVGFPALARECGMSVQFDTEGGFDVGIATKRIVGKGNKMKAPSKSKGPSKQAREAMAAKGGFGGAVKTKGKDRKAKRHKTPLREPAATEEAAAKVQAQAEAQTQAAAKAKAAAERAAAERAAAERAAAQRAAAERATAEAAAADASAAAPSAEDQDGSYLEVVCPSDVPADRTIRIRLPDSREFDVQVPEGVETGAAFLVGPFPPACDDRA